MKIVYITNARLPTEKAHGVQILKMIKGFSGLGSQTVLIHPKRYQAEISHKTDVFNFYKMEKVFQVKSLKFIDPYIFRPFIPKFIYRFFGLWVLIIGLFISSLSLSIKAIKEKQIISKIIYIKMINHKL